MVHFAQIHRPFKQAAQTYSDLHRGSKNIDLGVIPNGCKRYNSPITDFQDLSLRWEMGLNPATVGSVDWVHLKPNNNPTLLCLGLTIYDRIMDYDETRNTLIYKCMCLLGSKPHCVQRSELSVDTISA